jgi:streptomycin 6-kinase
MRSFEKNLLNTYGHTADTWLKALPELTENFAARWNLRDLVTCENLSFNYVLSGYQEDQPIILKLGIDLESIAKEFSALAAFNGYGMVNVLATDLDHGALLIERAVPGNSLKTLFPVEDSKATLITCQMIDKLHQAPIPKEHNFPLLTDWLQIIEQDWDLPSQQLDLARTLKNKLINNSKRTVLLHGDLHSDNILATGNEWIVIDPKGVIGDPIFDKIGSLIREPLPELLKTNNIQSIINNRINIIAQYYKLDKKLIIEWTYVHTIIAICWCIEDKHDPSQMQKFLSELTKAIEIN